MDYIAQGIDESLGKDHWDRPVFMFIAGQIDYIIGTADEMRAHTTTLKGLEKDPRATDKDYKLYGLGGFAGSTTESVAYMLATMSGFKTEAYIILADWLTRYVNSKRTKQPVGLIGTGRTLVHKLRDKIKKPETLEDEVA